MRLPILPLAAVLAASLAARAPLAAQARAAAPAAASIPPARAFAHRETILMSFDAPSGFGTVDLQPMALEGSGERLQALFRFRGQALAAPPERVSLALHARNTVGRHAATKTIQFVPDAGAPVAVPVLFRQVDSSAAGSVREVLALSMTRAQLLRLAAAERVEGRAGGVVFALGVPQLEALRDFASRMAPSAHRAALAAASGTGTGRPRRAGALAATEVDQRAAQQGGLVPPIFPIVPLAERTLRRVGVEFVVDTAGRVDTTSMTVLAARDSLFVAALRGAAVAWTFAPARKGGRVVAQVMTQAIPFDPGPPFSPPMPLAPASCTPEAIASYGGAVFTEDMLVPAEGLLLRPGATQMAAPLASNASPVRPRDHRGAGRVLVQLVVDATGAPVPCTLTILEATTPALGAAVRDALLAWRFEPALMRGVPVPQLVERALQFTP